MKFIRTPALVAACVASLVMGGLVLGVGAGPAGASSTSLYAGVGGSGSLCTAGSPCALTEALSLATNGETVDLAAGTYQPASDTSFTILTSVTVQPTRPGSTVILKGNGASVLVVSSSLTASISGVTIEDGDATASTDTGHGGGIFMNGHDNLTVTSTRFSDNTALRGGAIDSGDGGSGTLFVANSTFSGNSATDGGAIDSGDKGGGNGVLTIADSTFSGNNATDGGAIDSGDNLGTGDLTVTSSTFSGNTAIKGGGIYNNGGMVTLTSSTVSGNTATNEGGGIDIEAGTVTLNGSFVAQPCC
jgi:predicted outer membrane repeat protein